MKRVRLEIVSQICETMIRMSCLTLAPLLLSLAFSGALAGCCGGAHSHKCDFTSLDSQKDAGTDGHMMCGTLDCTTPNVCCLQKIAPYYSCVPLQDFDLHQCEKPDVNPQCLVPKDCDSGKVCCLQYAATPPTLNCQATCQGPMTYQACATDLDCPTQLPGSCGIVAGDPDAGTALYVCPPQP